MRTLKIFSTDGEDLLAILEWDGALTAKFAHSSLQRTVDRWLQHGFGVWTVEQGYADVLPTSPLFLHKLHKHLAKHSIFGLALSPAPSFEAHLLEASETVSTWPQWKRDLLGVSDGALPDEELEDIRAHVAYSLSGPGQAAQMAAHALNRTSAAHCLTLLCEVDRLRAKILAITEKSPE